MESKDNSQSQFSPSTLWILDGKHGSPDLAAGAPLSYLIEPRTLDCGFTHLLLQQNQTKPIRSK